MTAHTARVAFNPFDAEFRRDPYPHYRQLRETRPVHRTLGMWVLTRYADVRGVLHDRTFSAALIPRQVSAQAERLGQSDMTLIDRLGRTSLVFTDNPEHARLRALVNRAFTTQQIDGLRPLISAAATRLLEQARRKGRVDIIADFAAPLPVAVLCEWMALPEDLRARIGPWTHDIRFLLEPGLMTAHDLARVHTVVTAFTGALRPIIDQRRAAPGQDLISALLTSYTLGGNALTDDEVMLLTIMCFVAGLETTKSLIGNALLALLRHQEQAELLRARPELMRAAVAETLRYDPPLQLTKRLATRDIELEDRLIRARDQVLLCLAAANRDPDVFDRPDDFDITRAPADHLAFGHGMHGCLGAPLAALQAEIALDVLHRHTTEIRLATTDFDWQQHSFILRGLTRLPITLRGNG